MHTLHDYYLLCPRVDADTPGRRARASRVPLLCGLRTRRLARWAGAVAAVIGVSALRRPPARGSFRAPAQHVVRHPVTPRDGDVLPAPRERPATVGYLGSLDRVKGVDLLLEAAATSRRPAVAAHRRRRTAPSRGRGDAGVDYAGPSSGGATSTTFLAGCDARRRPVGLGRAGRAALHVRGVARGRPAGARVAARRARRGGRRAPGRDRDRADRAGIESAVRALLEPEAWRVGGRGGRPGRRSPGDFDRWLSTTSGSTRRRSR